MSKINPFFKKLNSGYLFKEVEKASLSTNKKIKLINLGIGDITIPLSKIFINSICKAAKKLQYEKTKKGYCDSQGELNLRKKIKQNDYKNLNISEDEIFISSGIKRDIAAIQELFSKDAKIAICDPSYPVYLDSNIIAGRTNIYFLKCLEKNNFLPTIPQKAYDLIYLCSPNNPTGVTLTKKELKKWVAYAIKHKSIILFDGAYEAFITNKNLVKSIYEIKGAEKVAIEFRSFSKKAGFTSLRLSYLVIPKSLKIEEHSINDLWKRLLETKFGAVSYPIQHGGLSTYTKKGKEEIKKLISYYMTNANILKKGLQKLHFKTFGGENSPYIWCKTLNNLSSWDFFHLILKNTNIITIPGKGFGECGENFIRFSAFANRKEIQLALKRLENFFK